ncbi:flocculation protein FLO11 [Canna indica]|uniref:Flocculation protein FLO11 n=1 Tax=Canna indica TaxID=4628 RepID=A0AAQ3KBF5_9LILI|nr:flocculation protein FLO11 [Canna indica]
MGSCVSKCYTTPTNDSSVMQDKLVISESPPLTNSLSCDIPGKQTTSSSSCSLLSASSPAVSSSNSSSSLSSSSATISSFLLSFSRAKFTPKESPCIVVLDPQKLGGVQPKPVKPSVQTLQPAYPRKQSMARISDQSFASKRARSSSPTTVTILKNSRTVNSSAVVLPCRKLTSSSTLESPRSSQLGKQRHEVGMTGDLVPPRSTARKQRMQSWSPYSTSISSIKETSLHHIHQAQAESREIASRLALIDDLRNPLICMECFIFL